MASNSSLTPNSGFESILSRNNIDHWSESSLLQVPPHTCQYCSVITIHMPSLSTIQKLDVGDKISFAKISGSYVRDASASCLFFNWAIAEFQKGYKSDALDESWTLNVGALEGHFQDYPDLPFLQVYFEHCNADVSTIRRPWLTVLAESDNAAAKMVPRRPERLNISSTTAFNQLRRWISVCDESHEACRRNPESYMPSNVIQIIDGMAGEPKLRIQRTPPREHYTALSYCWGEGQSIKATKSTMNELTRNINFRDLPKTLQDAITVTSKLGCRFLWVDVLCIIQDDEIHTAKEIALMPKIYENAYVTIIAARSRSCDQGFLNDIIVPSPSSHVFRFPLRGHNSSSGSILCFGDDENHHIFDPTESRAWPMQEFLLSSRVIRFGAHQVTWLCPCSWESQRKNEASNWWLRREKESVNIKRKLHQRLGDLTAWDQLVWDYTSRKLSKSGDKLLAISGIATKLAEQSRDTYIGGMWYRHLPRGLLWEVGSFPVQPRPYPYVAPSWSWASVDGQISCPASTYSDTDPDLQVLSTDSELLEPTAPYGNLKSASITIRGWIRRLYWTDSSSTLLELNQPGPGEHDPEDTLAFTVADSREDASHDMLLVWCLQICITDTKDGPHGIILTKEPEGVFRRRGIFTFSRLQHQRWSTELQDARLEKMKTWKDFCSLQDIIII